MLLLAADRGVVVLQLPSQINLRILPMQLLNQIFHGTGTCKEPLCTAAWKSPIEPKVQSLGKEVQGSALNKLLSNLLSELLNTPQIHSTVHLTVSVLLGKKPQF